MPGRKKRKSEGLLLEFPVMAFFSIIFLLLMYFLVTKQPIVEETFFGVDMNLEQSARTAAGEGIFIEIPAGGALNAEDIYLVDGRAFRLKDLRDFLRQAAVRVPSLIAVISFNPGAEYARLIKLLDLCSASGISKIEFAGTSK